MGLVKQYTISPTFRKASNRSLVKHLPSDLLYSFGAALFDKANKQRSHTAHEFYRMSVNRVLQCVNSLRKLEGQYGGSK